MLSGSRRDLLAGAIIGLFGAVGIVEGQLLGTGTLAEMGPGYVPTALGALLVVLGLLTARVSGGADPARAQLHPQWRGWACIVLGVLGFIALGPRAGLMPATFACVFIAALGDRTATLRGSAVLATCVTVFGAVLFHYLLQMNLPLFGGRA